MRLNDGFAFVGVLHVCQKYVSSWLFKKTLLFSENLPLNATIWMTFFSFFFPSRDWNIWQLLNEPEYDVKNYAGQGDCSASAENSLRDQHKSSHYTKPEYNNCFITSWLEISTLAIESHDVSTSPRSFSPTSEN